MDGIPALDFWDLVIEVFHSSPNQQIKYVRESRGNLSATPQTHKRNQIPTTNTNLDLINIDYVPSSETHIGSSAITFVIEDNEAVIKMITKRPKSRYVTFVQNPQSCLDRLFKILISIQKFRFVTLIPNTNSQTL